MANPNRIGHRDSAGAAERAPDPAEAYREAQRAHEIELERLRAEVRRLEGARMATFLIAALVGMLYRELPIGRTASLLVSAAAAVGFVVLVVRHRRLRRSVRRTEIALALARLGTFRLQREWEAIAAEHERLGYVDPLLDPNAERDPRHPYIDDLDVFGDASLRALLGPTPTPTGVATLRRWLREPAPVSDVLRRQRATQALAPDFDGRRELAIEALLREAVSERQWDRFREWLAEPPVFAARGGLSREEAGAPRLPGAALWIARLLPPVTLTCFFLDVVLGLGVPAASWAAPLALQAVLGWWWGGRVHGFLARATGSSTELRGYHGLFRAWEEYGITDPTLAAMRDRFGTEGGHRPSEEIRRLERWLDAAESRHSMFYVIFAWALLSDVHIVRGLERWRLDAGRRVEEWFDALGELEAVVALATLAHDHPGWCWPELRDGEPGFEAERLGHPLLPEAVLKTSDVRLDGPGRFLLVTGSNMSGKSTLLRSIGLATVMAQAGSAVCARRAVLTPLRTFTSMRIQDSLTSGVSLFMAELNRLKALVDAADDRSDGRPLLYLIDEVMQGTNSDERRIAARRIVSHLLASNAIGAVTTHDLSLHLDDRLDPAATKVHFREHVGGGDGAAVLTFDYKLRPGLATSRNALKLLELVGLGAEEGPD